MVSDTLYALYLDFLIYLFLAEYALNLDWFDKVLRINSTYVAFALKDFEFMKWYPKKRILSV